MIMFDMTLVVGLGLKLFLTLLTHCESPYCMVMFDVTLGVGLGLKLFLTLLTH